VVNAVGDEGLGQPDVFVFCPFGFHFAFPPCGVAFELAFYAVVNLLLQRSVGFECLFPCYVSFRAISVRWVVEDFVKDAVRVPRRAGADEFAVCGAEREKHCIVQFFVVGDEVEFVRVDDVEFWSADGFRVVGVGFYGASVGEGDGGFLRFLIGGFWEFGEEAVDVFDYEFYLSPAWSDHADVDVSVCQGVVEEEGAYGVAFSCFPCPAGGDELAVLELAYEFGLVGGWGEAEGLRAELNGVCWIFSGLAVEELLFKLFEFAFLLLFRLSTPPVCLGQCLFGVHRSGRRWCL
jgi:hypothetical protein